MRTSIVAVLVALAAPLAWADVPSPPPAAPETLKIPEGKTKPVSAFNGSQIVCDDPSVAAGEVIDEKWVIRGLRLGETTCAVRFDGVARAVYQVVVIEAEKKR